MAEPRAVSASGELKSLTSLRGLAAMAVVLEHFCTTAQSHSRVPIPSLVGHGYLAVDFFFVLSGFIMAYTYLDSFKALGARAFPSFLGKRVARIFPLNVAAVVFILLASQASLWLLGRNVVYEGQRSGGDILANLLMVQGLVVSSTVNGPAWSVSAEFAAYIVFPVFVAAMFGRRWLAGAAVLAAVCGVVWLQTPALSGRLALESPPASVLRCFFEFTLGLAAYRAYRAPAVAALFGRDLVTIGLSALVAAGMAARADLPVVLSFPFLVVAYAANAGLAARVMQNRLFHFLGIISFSLYMLHNPFRGIDLAVFRALAPQPVGMVAALGFAVLGACAVIPVAWLFYVAVERPGRRAVRGLLSRRAAPVVA